MFGHVFLHNKSSLVWSVGSFPVCLVGGTGKGLFLCAFVLALGECVYHFREPFAILHLSNLLSQTTVKRRNSVGLVYSLYMAGNASRNALESNRLLTNRHIPHPVFSRVYLLEIVALHTGLEIILHVLHSLVQLVCLPPQLHKLPDLPPDVFLCHGIHSFSYLVKGAGTLMMLSLTLLAAQSCIPALPFPCHWLYCNT